MCNDLAKDGITTKNHVKEKMVLMGVSRLDEKTEY
jgi:hypothetical protein